MTSTVPPAAWLTVERALYGVIILVAAGLRFFLLTVQPLNNLEATNAWQAWLVANGGAQPMAIAPSSPLLHALYTIAFFLFGGTDLVARTLPALCGIATVWLLWYWRDWLGRTTTLVAALLLCIDPWFTYYSRLADSSALTIFCGMLTLTALIRLTMLQKASAATADVASTTQRGDDGDDGNGNVHGNVHDSVLDDALDEQMIQNTNQSWQQLCAIGLGLLLISGPQMWSWLVVLALFIGLVLPAKARQALIGQPTLWALTAGVAIVGATGWLARPEGLGAISTSLTVWLGQWRGGETPDYPLGWFIIRLLTDSPLLLLFGLIGLARGWLGRVAEAGPTNAPFLTAWLLWGLVLVITPGRGPLALAMVGLPLLLLAAGSLAALVEDMGQGVQWQENGLLLLVLGVLFLSFTFFLATFANTPTFDNSLARTLALIAVLSILLVVAYALWIDGRQARIVIGSGVATILLLWTISSCWELNHVNDLMHPDGFFATFTNPDVRRLADAVATLSAQRHGDATELPLQVEMHGTPDPVLGWYLREMRNLAWVLAPGSTGGQSPMVVITLANSTGISGLATAYLGSHYALRDQWLPTQLTAPEIAVATVPDAGFLGNFKAGVDARWTARTRKLLRWMIYHKIDTLPVSEEVTLWVATEPEVGE